MPKRIQRKRTRGWRMPENAVYVGRPTPWGNPFKVGSLTRDAEHAVELFREHLARNPELVAEAREVLAGKDLACWCAEEAEHCHATVWLEVIANQQSPGAKE